MSRPRRVRIEFKRKPTTRVVVAFGAAFFVFYGSIFVSSNANVVAQSVGAESATRSNIRLRFSWGGGAEQTWQGNIVVKDGELSSVTPLSLTQDASTSVMISKSKSAGDLQIRHQTSTTYGGADATLVGVNAQVSVSLTSLENPEVTFEKTVAFADLVSGVVGGTIDQLGNRFSVTRVPGDDVGVTFDREHLIFEPEEQFEFSIAPTWTSLSTKKANARIKVVPAKSQGRMTRPLTSSSSVFQIDNQGSSAAQKFSIKVPKQEGVYNIGIEIESAWYQSSFTAKKTVLNRTIQFVVLSKEAPIANKHHNWRQVSTHSPVDLNRPSMPSWAQLSSLGQQSRVSLGNDLRKPVVVENRDMVKLLPGGWQAIPISVDELNRPHVVELEYIAEDEMVLGLSLLEPDANGQIPLFGFDSGVFIPDSLVKGDLSEKIQRHRLTVWPKTKTPYLLVANRQAIKSVTIGLVNVFAGPERLEPRFENADAKARKLMAFYEIPLFTDNFGAREADESIGTEPLDDWQMFYEGADRMIQYLKANSYGGAFITVACDGSSIYPSDLLNPSPKHDNGVFFSKGQDPIRKDVLEMLFRMFEREGLALVPTLSLSAPLVEVEEMIDVSVNESGAKLVNLNQQSPNSEAVEKLPAYNPLNRNVQRSVTRIVKELADRYKSYRAFKGIAVTCRPDTYTLLPGRNWGYDPVTVQQFVQAQTDLNPVPSTVGHVQELLLGSHRNQWTQWRANRMAAWYEDMAATVRRSIPKGELYLAPIDLYSNKEIGSVMSPSLHSSSDFGQVMLNMGFLPRLAKGINLNGESSGIVMLNPHRFAPDETLAEQRVDLEARNAKQVKEYFDDSSYSGDLFSHRISWAHFEQLQSDSPFGRQQNPLMRLQQMSPVEHFNRERFVQAIKDRDARMLVDGGWMMTMGQESALLEMMSVFGQLPDEKFLDVASSRFESMETVPLAVRELNRGDHSYFYVVNASPWPMTVKLWVNANSKAGVNIISLSNGTFVVKPSMIQAATSSQNRDTSLVQLVVEVEPFGLVGAKSDDPNLHVADFDFDFPQDVEKTLRKHIYLLQSKLTKAENSTPINVIDNAQFEVNGQASMNGWDIGQQSAEKVKLDSSTGVPAENGEPTLASVSLIGGSHGAVWLRSNSFEAPETGRLSISVWLKTLDPKNQPPLRLSVEGQISSGDYYRFGSVGSLSLDPKSNQIGQEWKRFAVHFDDLPLEEMTNVRIGFDLMGPGQVSIDNVQVFDRWFDKNDAKAITQMLASAGQLLSRKESYDRCRRLLEGYWPRFLDHYIPTDDHDSTSISVSNGSNQMLEPISENEMLQSGSEQKRQQKKIPMFRRIRNMVPQRNR